MDNAKRLKLIKDGSDLILKEESKLIEKYSFDKNIDFSDLIKYLTDYGFESKIDVDCPDDLDENEAKLADLIKKILSNYNEKVEAYLEFLQGVDPKD